MNFSHIAGDARNESSSKNALNKKTRDTGMVCQQHIACSVLMDS